METSDISDRGTKQGPGKETLPTLLCRQQRILVSPSDRPWHQCPDPNRIPQATSGFVTQSPSNQSLKKLSDD